MENCLNNRLRPRISAPELYPVSVGGAMIHQSSGDDCLMGGTMFLNAGIGVSALQCSEDTGVLPCKVEVAWFSFTEKRAFYAEIEIDDRFVSKVVKEGYALVNGLRGCYNYFDIALFPAGRVAFYLSGDERMTLIGLHTAKETDFPVSVFAPDAGFEDYEEFAEAFINGDECDDGVEGGSVHDDLIEDGSAEDGTAEDDSVEDDSVEDAKAPWIVNLIENGVDYPMIERSFERYCYEMILEDLSTVENMEELVFSVEFANGEFCKYRGNRMPNGYHGIVKSVSFEHQSEEESILYDIYFDIDELATVLSPVTNLRSENSGVCHARGENDNNNDNSNDNNNNSGDGGNSQLNSLILSFDDIEYTVSVKFADVSRCRNMEKIKYRVAEYNGRRTVLKGGNFHI